MLNLFQPKYGDLRNRLGRSPVLTTHNQVADELAAVLKYGESSLAVKYLRGADIKERRDRITNQLRSEIHGLQD